MTRSLPDRPSLEFLKNQAKDLLRAARAGDEGALSELNAYRRAESPAGSEPSALRLADALHAVACQYGFSTWTLLKQHLEDLEFATQQRRTQAEQLVRCCWEGPADRAERLADQYPDLARDCLYLAAAIGDLESLRRMLDRDPQQVNASVGPYLAPLLYYACASHLVRPGRKREPMIQAVVGELLARGADPNSLWLPAHAPDQRLSVLYAATGIHANPMLAQRLLMAGATPDDNESLYHSVEHANTACTELLLDHQATIAGTNAVPHAVSLGNFSAVELLLQRGADVNQSLGGTPGMTLLHWAIENNQSREMLELLIRNGADMRAISSDGMTPFRRAASRGHSAALDVLQSQGISEPLQTSDEFLLACTAGDERRAKELIAADPAVLNRLPHQGRGILHAAAWRGHANAVRVLVAVGVDVASTDANQATALHAAAWHGHLELVEWLLQAGAPLNGKDLQFHCTPLEWALHGSVNCPRAQANQADEARDAAYAKIVSLLVAAGSPAPQDRLAHLMPDA